MKTCLTKRTISWDKQYSDFSLYINHIYTGWLPLQIPFMLQKQIISFFCQVHCCKRTPRSTFPYLLISHHCLHPPFLPWLLLHLFLQAYHPCQVNPFLLVLLSVPDHLLVLVNLEIKFQYQELCSSIKHQLIHIFTTNHIHSDYIFHLYLAG